MKHGFLALPALLLYPSLGSAQDTPAPPPAPTPPPAGSGTTTAQPPDTHTSPTPPITFDAPSIRPPRPGTAPIPQADTRTLILENAETANGGEDGRPLVLSGNVRLRYGNYRASSDRATYDRNARILTFEGRVVLETGTQIVYADYVRVNTRTREFFARDGRTVVAPEQLGPDIIEPVFLQGRTLERNGEILTATEGQLTTCDFPFPHYKIGFRQADLIPNNRIVLRDATVYRYDRPLFRLRYLVIPVRERPRFSYLPNVGRTNEEGYFVKLAFGYALSQTLPGLLRLDWMEKKGIGVGFDQTYRLSSTAAGTVFLYSLQDRNRAVQNLNGRLNHQQYIGDTLATIASDFQNNSYNSLSPNSRTGQTSIALSRSEGRRNTDISVSQNNSDYGDSDSINTNYALSQTERFGRSSVTFKLNGTDTTSRSFGQTSGRQEQLGELDATTRLGVFDAKLRANRSLQLRQKGSTGGNIAFSGTQRLPDLSLSTESNRLSGFFRRIPGSYSIGYGRFLENITSFDTAQSRTRQVTTSRFLFEFRPEDKLIPLTPGGGLSLNLGGTFQQTVYRQDAAQYVLSNRTTLTQRLGAQSSLNFGYNYLRPYGGAPPEFRLDQVGSSNNLSSTLTINTYRIRASLISGYDIQEARSRPGANFRRTPWQNVALQLALNPTPIFQTRFTAAYDINTGKLLDASNRFRIRGENRFALDGSLRYDPRRYRFPQATSVLTVPIFSRDVTLSALTSYNGITNRFDYKQFYLTQSFHDYELLLSFVDQPFGFRRERGFNFSIRLKAFPTLRPPTTGQFGTPLDTGSGDVF